MAERLNLASPKTRRAGPGMEGSVPSLDVMDLHLHREPAYDEASGARTGWKADGSFIDVHLAGDFGHVETVRIHEGREALNVMAALNTANLSNKSLMEHLIERVEAYTDPTGSRPYAGTFS